MCACKPRVLIVDDTDFNLEALKNLFIVLRLNINNINASLNYPDKNYNHFGIDQSVNL